MKADVNNWSLVGMFLGALLFVSSVVRYYVFFADWGNMAVFCSISACIMAFSWVYHILKKTEERVNNIEDYLGEHQEKLQ